jgi:SHS2 domain-containing protein
MQRGHVSFEHTADIGIEAWSKDLRGLIEEVVLGLCELIADLKTIQATEERPIEVSGVDREELLVAASNEVVFYVDAQSFLSKSLVIESLRQEDDLWQLTGKLLGEIHNPEKHTTHTEIKSTTYHDLKIIDEENGLRVRVVFDV